jgi:ABC-type proline/glycine betaine transport system permease subunit
MEMSPVSIDELDKQRIRWFQDIDRTYFKMCNIGTWKENMATLAMFLVVMFPIFAIPIAVLYMEHTWGYNLITHTLAMQKISLRALLRTVFGKSVLWDVTKK